MTGLGHRQPGHSHHGDVIVLAEADGCFGDMRCCGAILHQFVQAVEAVELAVAVAGFDYTIAEKGELLALRDGDDYFFVLGLCR